MSPILWVGVGAAGLVMSVIAWFVWWPEPLRMGFSDRLFGQAHGLLHLVVVGFGVWLGWIGARGSRD